MNSKNIVNTEEKTEIEDNQESLYTFTGDAANLFHYPTEIENHEPGSTIVISDLHANPIKLIYILIREGAIELENGKETYDNLVEFYNNFDAEICTKEELAEYQKLLSNIKVKNKLNILLQGDDICDRGKCDLFIFFIYLLFIKLNINYKILDANHTREFIKQFIQGLTGDLVLLYKNFSAVVKENNEIIVRNFDYEKFGASYYGLRKLIERGIVDLEEVEQLFEQVYLSKLKLFSYHQVAENNIILHSHAPCILSNVEAIYNLFQGYTEKEESDFNKDTIDELIVSINMINTAFTKNVKDKNALQKFMDFKYQGVSKANNIIDYLIDESSSSYDRFINSLVNQRYEDLKPTVNDIVNYSITNLHGHVGYTALNFNDNDDENILIYPRPPKVANNYFHHSLDTSLGKEFNIKENVEHHYIMFVVKPNQYTLTNQIQATSSPANSSEEIDDTEETSEEFDGLSNLSMYKKPQIQKIEIEYYNVDSTTENSKTSFGS